MNNTQTNAQQEAAQEIIEAIRRIAEPRQTDPQVQIRVLQTMTEFQYLHTCPKCGCHLATQLWIEPDPYEAPSKICLHCQHVYESAKAQEV